MGRRLYVGNLPYSTVRGSAHRTVQPRGKVDNVRVMRDMATGRARGFAFVEMSTDEEAQKAITSCTSTSWTVARWSSTKRGRSLKVDLAVAAGRGRGGGLRSGGGNRGGGGYGDDFGGGAERTALVNDNGPVLRGPALANRAKASDGAVRCEDATRRRSSRRAAE